MENKKEKDFSQRASSSTQKFNSELFNKPFTENDLNNKNNPSLNNSILSHQSNNDVSSHNISFNKSLNSSLNDTNKKRKPFDNIHFQGNALEDINTSSVSNSLRSSAKLLNVSESMPKSNADTEITANKKCLKVNETHEMISRNNQANEIENMNNTKMSEMDKSSLLRTQSALDKETVSKALKYNKASDKENCPFWVKFFLEENVNLNENSSYFKAKDKEQYIKTMIEITKNDAKLEEKNKILKENKDKTFNELKKLLLTEMREENKIEEEKEKCQNLDEDNEKKEKKSQKNQMKKKENIANLVSKYSDSNKRENYLEKNLDMNYYEFMKKQKELDENKKENHIQKNIKNVGGSPLMNKYNHKKQISLNQDEVYKNEDPYPSLEQLDFEKENYDKIAFRYYGKDVLKSLFDIDAKLEKLNPAYKNFSTKSDLRNLKENYKKSSSNKTVKKQSNIYK